MAKEIFDIQDGALIRYNGNGGEIVIPETVSRVASGAF